jgi:deazaflavin-dependent oxidoreductase (nitroreductase family)
MSEVTQNPPLQKTPPQVPRWLVRTIWIVHRATYSITRGRFGLRPSTSTQWGMLRLTSVGRRSGKARVAIVGYIVDGPNLVVPAMNGWADPEPAWWLNLQASPNTSVELPDGRRDVRARAAVGRERDRLWARFLDLKSSAFTDASAALRSRETALVVLEPRGTGVVDG